MIEAVELNICSIVFMVETTEIERRRGVRLRRLVLVFFSYGVIVVRHLRLRLLRQPVRSRRCNQDLQCRERQRLLEKKAQVEEKDSLAEYLTSPDAAATDTKPCRSY